jgi:HK97 family phage prohead protease
MPLPFPSANESQKEFIKRCMIDENVNAEFPDKDQRFAVCMSQLNQGKNFNLNNIELKEIMLGDYVTFDSNKGPMYGRISKRVSDGTLDIPGNQFKLDGSEDNPAYLIRLYRIDDEGNYAETNKFVAERHENIKRALSPEFMKDDIDINLESDEEEDDSEEREAIEALIQYVHDSMMHEDGCDCPTETMGCGLAKGDYVSFEVGNGTYKGRILDVVGNGGSIMSTAGTKLDGLDDDPAVLIRLYREGDQGFDESDIKVVHRASSLIKIPALNGSTEKEKKNLGGKETKVFAFQISETKEIDIDGQRYGLVRGYASTYGNVDRGNDKVLAGAFTKSLNKYKGSGRPIKMYYQHDNKEIIGGFPIDKIRDDGNGLYVEGQINLDVQKGREAYALAKQGVMTDFSIGYTVNDYDLKAGVRELKDLDLWEISMVGEPMNEKANILSVKAVAPFQDLPLVDELNYQWDADAAIQRIRKFTDSEDKPSESYKKAFMWFDDKSPDDFTSYKLPFADVVKGKLVAIPKAISAIKAVLNGGRGGIDIPAKDQKTIMNYVERYEAKMDAKYVLPIPEGIQLTYSSASMPGKEVVAEQKQVSYDDALNIKTKRDLEKVLRESGLFTKRAAIYLSSKFNEGRSDSVEQIGINEVNELINYLNGVKNGVEDRGGLPSS